MFEDCYSTLAMLRNEIKTFHEMMKEGVDKKFDNSPQGIEEKLAFIEERMYYHTYLLSFTVQAKQIAKQISAVGGSFDIGRQAKSLYSEFDDLYRELNSMGFALTQMSKSTETRLKFELSKIKDCLI